MHRIPTPIPLILLLILVHLSGCLKTTLDSKATNLDVFELAAENTQKLKVKVVNTSTKKTAGRQFLFVFIPFGRIVIKHPEDFLSRSFYTHLSIKGYKPITHTHTNAYPQLPELSVEIDNFQATAYDYFFYRRIVCKIALTATLNLPNQTQKVWSGTIKKTAAKRYAFKPQLENIFNKAIEAATLETIKNLRL